MKIILLFFMIIGKAKPLFGWNFKNNQRNYVQQQAGLVDSSKSIRCIQHERFPAWKLMIENNSRSHNSFEGFNSPEMEIAYCRSLTERYCEKRLYWETRTIEIHHSLLSSRFSQPRYHCEQVGLATTNRNFAPTIWNIQVFPLHKASNLER